MNESVVTQEILLLLKTLLSTEDIEYHDNWPLLLKWLNKIEQEKLDIRFVSREY